MLAGVLELNVSVLKSRAGWVAKCADDSCANRWLARLRAERAEAIAKRNFVDVVDCCWAAVKPRLHAKERASSVATFVRARTKRANA